MNLHLIDSICIFFIRYFIPDVKMSQPELISDLDVPENPQHPCQCSTINNMDPMRTSRDRMEKNVNSTRISNNQDTQRNLETLQNIFEPVRRLESPHQDKSQINLDNTRNVDLLEHQANMSSNSRSMNNQNSLLSLHGHNLSCSPRNNLDLSRNLAFEAARRVQETSSLQDNQHSLTSSPSPLLETGSNLLETAGKELDKQLEDHASLSPQKQSSSKEKLKNVQQVLNSYQHHHESAAVERGVHGHFHGDIHSHIHKHADNFRNNTNLDESLMGFQRQHTHHHHSNTKTNVTHHHGSGAHHTHTQGMTGHHHGNLATNLTSHVHGNSGPLNGSGLYLLFLRSL